MTDATQTAVAPGRFERVWDGPIMVRLRAYVLPSVTFAVPVYFAQKFLQHLGGSALWFPRDWREVVGVIGTAIGLAAFNWARLRDRRKHGVNVGAATKVTKGSRRVAPLVAQESPDDERASQLRSLAWYGGAIAFIVAYTFLRHHCVHTWQPRDAWIDMAGVRYGGAEGLPSFIELSPYSNAAAPRTEGSSVHAAEAGPSSVASTAAFPVVWRGTFLTPIWFTDGTRAELDRRERERGLDGVQYCLQQDEDWLIDALTDREENSMSTTTLVFLLLHIGVLGCTAAAFGSSFTLSEDLASKLAEIR